MRTKRTGGITLVELLIALAVLSVVLTLAYAAITGSLQAQSRQEAAATTQAKLRRIIEVISQDLRGAVFGSITNQPYSSGDSQVSFMMLTGGAGYQVANSANFANSTTFQAMISTAEASQLVGKQVVLVNSDGLGVVKSISASSSGSSSAYRKLTSSCRNTIDFSSGVLMFQIESTGIRYDEALENMYVTVGGAAEEPFAFNISDLRFDYVYTFTRNIVEGDDSRPVETVVTLSDPVVGPHGMPVRSFVDGNYEFTLTRLQIVVGSVAESRGSSVDHAYSGQVDLSRAAHFKVEEIVPCS